MNIKRIISIYLAIVAVVVTVQFVAYPLYAYDEAGNEIKNSLDAMDVWHIIDWFMAGGLILAVATSFMAKQAHDANLRDAQAGCVSDGKGLSGSDVGAIRQWFECNLIFYSAVLLLIAFIPNWIATVWSFNSDGTIWHLIDTILPVLFVVQARRLWVGADA